MLVKVVFRDKDRGPAGGDGLMRAKREELGLGRAELAQRVGAVTIKVRELGAQVRWEANRGLIREVLGDPG